MTIPLVITHISECFIRPKFEVTDSNYNKPIHLTPWDLVMMSQSYIRKSLFFSYPPPIYDQIDIEGSGQLIQRRSFVEKLKESLSLTLVYFYQLVGQLVTRVDQDACFIFIDCNKGPGAKFVHASLDVTLDEVLSPTSDVPQFVDSFYDKEAITNYDGHISPLLSIKVTDLVDGVVLGCSMNHAVVDGASFWHFMNMWSEIFKTNGDNITPISRPPVNKRWFPDGFDPIVRLPYSDPRQFIFKNELPPLRVKIFHFSSDSLAKLKAKTNAECNSQNISTYLAMASLLWTSITRARSLRHDQRTLCLMLCNNRPRLDPPLSPEYFGNAVSSPSLAKKAGNLLEQNLGSVASQLKEVLETHSDKMIRAGLREYMQSPFFVNLSLLSCTVTLTSSSKFNMYGNEFGLGKPLAIRNMSAGRRDGNVNFSPGYEGGGSVDLEITLTPECMTALESDEEFMSFVS